MDTVDFVVYILWSEKYRKTYVGMTGNLIARFKSHNELGKGWTKRYRPWMVIFVKPFSDKSQALKFEAYLKSGVGRTWIKETLINKIK